ncbi:MAG TPA: ATP-binding protein [Chitinophagales bacterium]|nr:ATP-binding protein [Chitinophagales bacterium]
MNNDSTSRISTNWYVITGGPGSGKTTMVNLLKARGYKTTIENARHYFDMQRLNGKTVEEVRRHKEEFQLKVLEMQIELEKNLSPADVVFLDRAIPDALAYYRYLNIVIDLKLSEALCKVYYKKVFILDCLPLVQDYARTEDQTAQKKIHEAITEVYNSLPFPVVTVPVMLPHDRVDFILKNL